MKIYKYIFILMLFPSMVLAQRDAVWELGGAYPDTVANGFFLPYEMRFIQDSFMVYPTNRKNKAIYNLKKPIHLCSPSV